MFSKLKSVFSPCINMLGSTGQIHFPFMYHLLCFCPCWVGKLPGPVTGRCQAVSWHKVPAQRHMGPMASQDHCSLLHQAAGTALILPTTLPCIPSSCCMASQGVCALCPLYPQQLCSPSTVCHGCLPSTGTVSEELFALAGGKRQPQAEQRVAVMECLPAHCSTHLDVERSGGAKC